MNTILVTLDKKFVTFFLNNPTIVWIIFFSISNPGYNTFIHGKIKLLKGKSAKRYDIEVV